MTVFDYTDYRAFLKETILRRKKENPRFSFRYVAFHLGCNAGFFNKVVKGSRSLSSEHALRLSDLLKLKKREKQYFLLLVRYNQAKKQLEKEHIYQQLKTFQNAKIHQIGAQQYPLYENWFNLVIRELINAVPCFGDLEISAKLLSHYILPPVKPADIQKTLKSLLELGIIRTTAGGRLRLNQKLITTGSEIPTAVVERLLRQFFDLGGQALERFHKPERVCSTVTVSTSKKNYERMRERLAQCRKEILEIAGEKSSSLDRVYHMNLQLFPVTRPLTGDVK